MGSFSKKFSLLLVVILAISSLMTLESAFARLIPNPKPSLPEFTLKQISSVTEANNSTIELKIKNQPFNTSLGVSDSNYQYSLFYNVRTRINGGNYSEVYNIEGYPTQSNSTFTILTFTSSEEDDGHFIDSSVTSGTNIFSIYAPTNSSLDVQAEAMTGYRHKGGIFSRDYVFTGESSGWSIAQTITITESSATVSPSPTIPEFSWLAILPLIISLLSRAVILKLRHRKTASQNKPNIKKNA